MAKSTPLLPLPSAQTAPASVTKESISQQGPRFELDPPLESLDKSPLWLALFLPQLALEVVPQFQVQQPQVVCESQSNHRYIHTASPAALELGISPQMSLNSALALCARLQVFEYDSGLMRHRLDQMAHWAMGFSSRVSVQPPQSLLLEIRGSLKLFGGLRSLQTSLLQELEQHWRHDCHLAVSPSGAASLLLARCYPEAAVLQGEQLRSALGGVPVDLLPLQLKAIAQLKKSGIKQLRGLWRLPSAELAKRFGPGLTRYMEQLLGARAQSFEFFSSSEPFVSTHVFPVEVRSCHWILRAADRLLDELARFLQRRDICAHGFMLYLRHGVSSPQLQNHSCLSVGMRQPGRDAAHFKLLLKERLEAFKVPAPVLELCLFANGFASFHGQMPSLFAHEPDWQGEQCIENMRALLEQIQNRLGKQAVQGLRAVAEYRPELAGVYTDGSSLLETKTKRGKPQVLSGERPLWLLPQAKLLCQRQGRLWHESNLQLLHGPERVETAWWVGVQAVRRDYYIARDQQGRRLWLYRDLQNGHWYVQGLFA